LTALKTTDAKERGQKKVLNILINFFQSKESFKIPRLRGVEKGGSLKSLTRGGGGQKADHQAQNQGQWDAPLLTGHGSLVGRRKDTRFREVLIVCKWGRGN